MITEIDSGFYKLIETHNHTKILTLDGKTFAWVWFKNIGDILVRSGYMPHRNDFSLSMGHYTLYTVEDEPNLTDLQHLELEFGKNAWQGYLLLTGLPDSKKRRARIIPTIQTITGNPRYNPHLESSKAHIRHTVKQAIKA